MFKKLITPILTAIAVFNLVACQYDPVYQNFQIIPDSAKACVAIADQAMNQCKNEKLPLFEQCMVREQMAYKERLEVYKQKMYVYQETLRGFNTNKMMMQSEYQLCLSNCMQSVHKDFSSGKNIRNDRRYCVQGIWLSTSNDSECGALAITIQNMRPPSAPSVPDQPDCEYVYNACDQEQTIAYKQCGVYYERRCVGNCENIK